MRKLFGLLVLAMLVLGAPATSQAQIEAVKGKQYALTKKHGPWMIMVASLRDRGDNPKQGKGMSAQEAADELVFYLRKLGIPSYSFRQSELREEIATVDRLGRPVNREVTSQHDEVCVMAGNYDDPHSEVAQKTLQYIKRLKPEFLMDQRVSGVNFRPTPGQPTPLAGAFLSINPRLKPEEARQRTRDPLLLKLNSGDEYSLLKNTGKYTLVVASFYGKSLTLDPNRLRSAENSFEVESGLDEAAMDAWKLAQGLRQKGYEAYTFHDRYRSVVTVGAFNDANDARVRELSKVFGAKYTEHPQTHQHVLTAEPFVLYEDPKDPKHSAVLKTFIFDPSPQLLEVPRW